MVMAMKDIRIKMHEVYILLSSITKYDTALINIKNDNVTFLLLMSVLEKDTYTLMTFQS